MFKSFYGKIRKKFGIGKRSQIDELISMGVLKIGNGCNISGMHVFVPDKKEGVLSIEIGNDCCIRGILFVYKQDSKIKIGNNVYIGPQTLIECAEEIEIGNDVLISATCNLIDTNTHSLHSADRIHDTIEWQKGLVYKNWGPVRSKKISIGNKSWLGLRSIIMKGVVLGEGSIVAAGSVVTKSTDPFTMVAGNPAVFIKKC